MIFTYIFLSVVGIVIIGIIISSIKLYKNNTSDDDGYITKI